MYNDFFGGLLPQNLFNGTKRLGHVEHLADFRFADMQGHLTLLHAGAGLAQRSFDGP
jgi:hypothetical protein